MGKVWTGDSWRQSQNDHKYPGLMSAAEHIAAFTCRMHPIAARLSAGVRSLPNARGYSQVVTLLWRPGSSYARTLISDFGATGRIQVYKEFDDWEQLLSLQLLSTTELDTVEDAPDASGTSKGEASVDGDASRLSTIPEEIESVGESISDYLSHTVEEFQRVLESTQLHCSQFLEGSVP